MAEVCGQSTCRNDGDFQHLYHPDLDVALLQVHGLDGAEDRGDLGISSLFSAAKRPAFFHILRSFDVFFGQDSNLETVVGWRTHYEAGQRNLDISHRSHLLVVGTPLVPSIGLERLQATRTFAKWELPGPIFVYLSPAHMYTYEYDDGTTTVLPLHDFGSDELWDGLTDIRTPDEDGDALVLSTARLEQGLGLPRTVASP